MVTSDLSRPLNAKDIQSPALNSPDSVTKSLKKTSLRGKFLFTKLIIKYDEPEVGNLPCYGRK